MTKEAKELIEQVMNEKIQDTESDLELYKNCYELAIDDLYARDKMVESSDRLASLRNALDQFEKGNSDSYICPDCGDSGGVKTGEDEYSTCPCQNTTPSQMDKLIDWLEGELKNSKPKAIMYKETAFKRILKKAKELK